MCHFEELIVEFGISRTTLSDRLSRLLGAGLIERAQGSSDLRTFEYSLTKAGHATWPILEAIKAWDATCDSAC